RASFALYNTTEEVEVFAAALRRIVEASIVRVRPTALAPARSEPAYPRAVGASPQAVADDLAADFDLFDDCSDRHQYLIDLGPKLPPLPDDFRTEGHRVRGCQSTVFLNARKRPGSADVVEFLADSDADIVRGLIALLERVFSGQKACDIVAFDVESFFTRLGLNSHLSMGRRNGLAAMVQRVRTFA